MGMLYEYEGFDNLFENGEIVTIDAEYIEKANNGHKVRIKWYPEAIDNDGQIKTVDTSSIIKYSLYTKIKKGEKIQLMVEYIEYHKEDYHIICINEDEMIIHKSLFEIPEIKASALNEEVFIPSNQEKEILCPFVKLSDYAPSMSDNDPCDDRSRIFPGLLPKWLMG